MNLTMRTIFGQGREEQCKTFAKQQKNGLHFVFGAFFHNFFLLFAVLFLCAA